MLSKRSTSGVAAGASALAVLLAMSLNIGGINNFNSIVTGLGLFFLAATLAAFVLGLFTFRIRLRWTVLAGAAVGLLAGFGVLFVILQNI